jgi:hypothetical protein
MKRLEDELKKALRRDEPSDGFAERILAAAADRKQSDWSRLFAWPGLRWALGGAMCLMLAVIGIEYKRAQDEQARGRVAKAQLMLALRVTADKLQFAQQKVQKFDASSKY